MKKNSNNVSLLFGMIFTMFSFFSYAQVSGGIVAGVSTGAVEINQIDRRITEVVNGNNITGIEGGLFLKVKAGPVYVKPMALYSYQSGEVNYRDQIMNYKSNKLGIPVMFGLKLIGPLGIEAGPVYNYVVSITDEFNSTDDVMLAKNGFGYRAGVVLDFGTLIINSAYEGMTYQTSNANQTGFKEPYKIIFGVALRLGGGD